MESVKYAPITLSCGWSILRKGLQFGQLMLFRGNSARHLFLRIDDKDGIHGRPATALVTAARAFENTEIKAFKRDGESADLKSIMQLLSLYVPQGEVLVITFTGKDTAAAREKVRDAFVALSKIGLGGAILTFDELAEITSPK